MIFSVMPNIHQIHDIIRKGKCKYFFTEKQNRPRRIFPFSRTGLLSILLQLSLFGEQAAEADKNSIDSSPFLIKGSPEGQTEPMISHEKCKVNRHTKSFTDF